ncbi:MAG: hypothetical protein ABIT83_05205 [Massilia sp.]
MDVLLDLYATDAEYLPARSKASTKSSRIDDARFPCRSRRAIFRCAIGVRRWTAAPIMVDWIVVAPDDAS